MERKIKILSDTNIILKTEEKNSQEKIRKLEKEI